MTLRSSSSVAYPFDRQVVLAVILVSLVVVPRSALIARAHSETFDTEYHITRGLAYLTRTISVKDLRLNDPPLGEGLIALPVLVTNLLDGRRADDNQLFDAPGRAEKIAVRIAVWNSFLFMPLIATVFVWCRRLYGVSAAWLSAGMLAVEPNFAAHIPVAALDVMGVSGIVVACYFVWRYFESPSTVLLLASGAAIGTAMIIKHTAVILPAVVAAFGGLWWVVRPWRDGTRWAEWKAALTGRIRAVVLMGLITVVTIWLLTLFELCPPKSPNEVAKTWQTRFLLTSPWPAGTYIRAFSNGLGHSQHGHGAYLFGNSRTTGWWYYFPVLATYKIPVGMAIVILLAIVSVRRIPPRWAEWGLFLPFVAWSLLMMASKVNIGFRHFLPPYVFALALSCRTVSGEGLGWRSVVCWLAIALGGLHGLSYHPDYLSYINFPRNKPYLDISDSNIDWGQGQKQIREWLESHPQDGRKVWLRGFGTMRNYYLGDRVVILGRKDPQPKSGVLIISPVSLVGVYGDGPSGGYKALRKHSPDAVIGHSLLVYDLDRLTGGAPFDWTLDPK